LRYTWASRRLDTRSSAIGLKRLWSKTGIGNIEPGFPTIDGEAGHISSRSNKRTHGFAVQIFGVAMRRLLGIRGSRTIRDLALSSLNGRY
jgi:hypothetical protein